MSHYFVTDNQLESKRRLITFKVAGVVFELLSDRGVFSKDELDPGTQLLLETGLSLPWQGRVGDIGCGIGTVGIVLASQDPTSHVYLTDINARAVELASENCRRLQLTNTVLHCQDGIGEWPNDFDSLWLNPPIRAGKTVIYRLYQEAYAHLKEGGFLLVVIRKDQGAETTERELLKNFKEVHRIARTKGYHIYRANR